MEFNKFIEKIRKRMADPLPGATSQLKMAGMKRLLKEGKIVIPGNAKKSAVLILFYPSGGKIKLVFIKRTEYPGVHSGQISFPGGGWEARDRDMIATALREAEEEISVGRNSVTPVGTLTDLFIPPSNFLVTPVVGYIDARPEFKPDPDEVDQILEISLEDLLRKENRQEKMITIFPGIRRNVPCFYVNGNIIWGATAMILSELIDLVSSRS